MSDEVLRTFALPPMAEGADTGLDWTALARPISEDRPAGESLRYDGTITRITEARREDDSSLPQGVWQTALKTADWRVVRDLCREVLEGRSKDLQVAVWLTEALAHRSGFTGLAAGLEAVRLLCATFWDGLHPEIEDGDADGRIAAIAWINQHLVLTVVRIPFCVPPSGSAFGLSDWRAARTNQAQRKREEDSGKGPYSPDSAAVQSALSATPRDRITAMSDALEAALETTQALDSLLDARLGREAPGLARLRETLAEVAHILRRERVQRGEADPAAPPPPEETAMTEKPAETLPVAPAAASTTTRDAAYRALCDAADFLARTEPHSPVPYLVRKAVRWGRMPLTELLPEMAGPDGDLRRLYEILGMETPRKS